ncbi:MAG: co-chaperone GroES [Armatimonadota bacterium]|nr:co-chaperone GroES [Armatimonadota bacterium]MCX7778314.1 co-chaperone GroES [Armatimonadota bacterium]MDW8025666.1 co-chaperone GroES [Armatimonadota bacterium]
MKIKPLRDKVLIKVEEEEEKTAGGIYLPDTAKERPQRGIVVAVGDGKVTDEGKVIPINVKVGDKVIFSKYAGTEIKLDGEKHVILSADDIYAIIED